MKSLFFSRHRNASGPRMAVDSGSASASIDEFSLKSSTLASDITGRISSSSLASDISSRISSWMHPKTRRIVRLGGDELLVETVYGYHMVIPGWNLDVGVGIARDGVIEPWTNQVLISLLSPGDHVVNVGANFGFYSLLAAQRVGSSGRVYAIEANPEVFPYLVKGTFWSGFPNIVQAYNCAAVSPDKHKQPLEFFSDPQFIGGGNLFGGGDQARTELKDCLWNSTNIRETLDDNRKFTCRGVFTKVMTEGRTVDSLVTDPIKAMLIDAEGSESFVIGGAKETIRKSPNLSIILEWDPVSYRANDYRRPYIDDMWNFLLEEQGFKASRICPENYRGIGSYPEVIPLDKASLFNVPHSDLLLQRNR
jgi:FkbM family methyltransferase